MCVRPAYTAKLLLFFLYFTVISDVKCVVRPAYTAKLLLFFLYFTVISDVKCVVRPAYTGKLLLRVVSLFDIKQLCNVCWSPTLQN